MTPEPTQTGADPAADRPPEGCAVAFKEWLGVCEALGSGRQSLILRKGGVAELGGEFRPEHPAFWLYPTVVHQAEQGLRTPATDRFPEGFDPQRLVPIRDLAAIEWVGRVDTLEQLDALRPWHDWTDATIRGRFDYRRSGLWALVVRVHRRVEAHPLAVTEAQLGCKTWVPLDAAIPAHGAHPVLDRDESARRVESIRRAIGAAGGGA